MLSIMSGNEQEVFRILCGVLGSPVPPVLRSVLPNAELLQELTALAQNHRILPAFDEAMAFRHGSEVAREIRAVCAIRQQHNRLRNLEIRRAVIELGREAACNGFSFALLKGAAWIFDDADNAAAWREMVDIDVLVESGRFGQIPALLEKLGYIRYSRHRRYQFHFHLAPYVKPHGPASVEVHRHLGWRHTLLPPELVFASSRPVEPGLMLPAAWCRAYHCILHWQILNHGQTRATILLKEMVDLDRLMRRSDVDWSLVEARAHANGTLRACEAALSLVAELFQAPYPEAIPRSPIGPRHVRTALARRSSDFRSWLARETSRVGTLWRDEKIIYRLTLRGAGRVRIQAAVWTARALRFPVLIVRLLGSSLRSTTILGWSMRGQKSQTRF